MMYMTPNEKKYKTVNNNDRTAITQCAWPERSYQFSKLFLLSVKLRQPSYEKRCLIIPKNTE